MPEVKLHADKFEDMIARRGRDVLWEQAIQCTCWNLDSGQPNAECMACGGIGYTYEPAVTERALVQSVTMSNEYNEAAGIFDIGDAVMTVPKRVFGLKTAPNNHSGVGTPVYLRDNAMFNVGIYDIITLLDDEIRTSEVLIKGQDYYERPADTLLNIKVTKLLNVRVNDPITGEIKKYEPGVDVTHTDNKIEWLTADAPPDGTQYSVTFMHRPVYTVIATLPKPRHQDNQDLPRYVVLRFRGAGTDPK